MGSLALRWQAGFDEWFDRFWQQSTP